MSELQIEAAHRQETHTVRTLDEFLVDQVLCIPFLTIEDKTAHLSQVLQRGGAVVVVRASTPERLFVQLDFLSFCTSIDHGTHA